MDVGAQLALGNARFKAGSFAEAAELYERAANADGDGDSRDRGRCWSNALRFTQEALKILLLCGSPVTI